MTAEGGRRNAAASLALVAAFLISAGVLRSTPSSIGVILVAVAFVLLVLAISGKGFAKSPWATSDSVARMSERLFIGFGVLASVFGIIEVSTPSSGRDWAIVAGLSVALGAASIGVLSNTGWRQARALNVFLAVYAVAMVAVLVWTHGDFIDVTQVDVTYFQLGGAAELASLRNPFAMTFVQIHGLGAVPPIYGEGVAVGGVLQFGFPYLPMSLLAVAPFQWLFTDFRIAFLVAVVGAGWMIGALGNNQRSRNVATGFVLAVPFVTMITVGWTEPLLVAAAVGIVYTHQRRSSLRPWVAGVFVALKQYSPILAPAYLLLLGRPFTARKVLVDGAKALVVVAVSTLPFLVWNPEAFFRSVLLLQLKQPARPDSLSFIARIPGLLDLPVAASVALSTVALVGALAYGLFKATDDAQGFSLTAALALCAWLLFGRQALANYYVLVLGFVAMAAAISYDRLDTGPHPQPIGDADRVR